ncbi:RICIN domain-containing protein [Hymenobacter monticola]|uniref:Family 43 glycosylhydrolase n=1 Tax=Hymenobacter monticola TaxID=1705399 RepID=A0ABY4B2T5_9BACT|nr:RICIN domain-containing protein [Hymenobacter monticola]UOE32351.1 family 43 glycosylhydrolase [Hymenobacter monticola]
MKSSFTSAHQPLAGSSIHAALKRLLPARLGGAWRLAALVLLLGTLSRPALALQGNDNCHDPSSIVKDGNKYWIFTTGTDIYAMYSYDLVKWESGPQSVFNGFRPAWIANRVPGFTGEYWAPECVYRNGKYYLYYSCSTFGSNVSAIGVATNVTLDPANPNYQWIDQGEVVASGSNGACNAIDPAIITDAAGGVWMTYGSFFKGLGLIKLDATTGKRSGTSFYWLAGNVAADGVTRNSSGSEAPYIVRNGSYYYLFLNKGACCKGSNSTYYIQVGRSTSVTGPYLDKNGVDLNQNGGTTLIATSGKYVGPGHVGLFIENGANYLSHHYYDNTQNGRARLSVGNMGYDGAGWPFITRDWLAAGQYTLTNLSSGKRWDDWGCTGALYESVAQGTAANLTCQKWNLTPDGNGEYRITTAMSSGLAAEVVGGSPNNGARLQLNTYTGAASQRFKIERASNGTYVLASVNGNRVVEVPACSATAGVQLALYDYLANACQQWTIAPGAAGRALAVQDSKGAAFSVLPNPAVQGRFVVKLAEELATGPVTMTLADVQGRVVYRGSSAGQAEVLVVADVPAGLYLLRVTGAQRSYSAKVVIQ